MRHLYFFPRDIFTSSPVTPLLRPGDARAACSRTTAHLSAQAAGTAGITIGALAINARAIVMHCR
jgi:hypothetical protein